MYNMAKSKGLRKYVMALLFIAIGVIIGTTMLCGCSCGREGFVVPSRSMSLADKGMNDGVPGLGTEDWRKSHESNSKDANMLNQQKQKSLFFYANNRFAPECCATSSVSSSSGCACVTSEQNKLLGTRGGNCANGPCSF